MEDRIFLLRPVNPVEDNITRCSVGLHYITEILIPCIWLTIHGHVRKAAAVTTYGHPSPSHQVARYLPNEFLHELYAEAQSSIWVTPEMRQQTVNAARSGVFSFQTPMDRGRSE